MVKLVMSRREAVLAGAGSPNRNHRVLAGAAGAERRQKRVLLGSGPTTERHRLRSSNNRCFSHVFRGGWTSEVRVLPGSQVAPLTVSSRGLAR